MPKQQVNLRGKGLQDLDAQFRRASDFASTTRRVTTSRNFSPIRRTLQPNARGALWAHGAGIEAAFLPDHASEKFDRIPFSAAASSSVRQMSAAVGGLAAGCCGSLGAAF